MPASPPPGLAVVTGASAGIGEALARELSRRGRPVLAVARREERLRALSEEARAAVRLLPRGLVRRISGRANWPAEAT